MKTKLEIMLEDFESARDFVNKASIFRSDINLSRGNIMIDGKSVLALFDFDLSKPMYVEIISDNETEIDCFNRAFEQYEVD